MSGKSGNGAVSIALPTHDRVAFLTQAVASVVRQTYTHWDLIIVDDGSADGTSSYLAGLDDPRIRAIERPHTGNIASLRNEAIQMATGDFIAFLDSDDEWWPRKLELQVDALGRHPECGWSYCGCQLIDEVGEAIPQVPPEPWRPISGSILEALLTTRVLVPTPTVIVRRALLEQVGGFDERLHLAEDFDLWIRLADRSPVLALTEQLVNIRMLPGSASRTGAPGYEAAARVYAKTGRATRDRAVRAICRDQYARHMIACARQCSIHGRMWRATAALAAVAGHGAINKAWWGELLRVIGRPVVPRSLRRRFLQWRQSRSPV